MVSELILSKYILVSSRPIYTDRANQPCYPYSPQKYVLSSNSAFFYIMYNILGLTKTLFLYVKAQLHISAWTKVPIMTVELSWAGQAVAMWPGYCDAGVSSMYMCVCFALGKAGGDRYRRLGVAILNSESICLAMDFQAIKEMDLKINSWVCALGLERGPLTPAFLKDDVSLILQWDRLGLVLPSQWTSTRDPDKEGWKTWVIYF